MLRIAADHSMPFVTESCGGHGQVTPFSPSSPESVRQALAQADAVLCRSTLRVTEDLLRNTPVRFVATATSGIEHVDTEYLASRGIGFAAARGCNARSVAEYVIAALLKIRLNDQTPFQQHSIGIIGVGEVGSRVAHIARDLGMKVLCNDPPLQEATRSAQFVNLETALAADIVTFHVPLTSDGPWPTRGLLNSSTITALAPNATLINTSRGEVFDMEVVAAARSEGRIKRLVLDVFPDEPDIDPRYIQIADIATPHIAGHSHDGKVRGTTMAVEALCDFFGVENHWNEAEVLSTAGLREITVPEAAPPFACVEAVVKQAYDISVDDSSLRRLSDLNPEGRREMFRELRRSYRIRREYACHTLNSELLDPASLMLLRTIGFSIV